MVSAFNPYNTLPVADEALDRGGVELLRVGLADEELFITLRSPFQKPDEWGWVLADITRHLADHYSANSDLTEDDVVTAVAQAFAQSLRNFVALASSSGTQTKWARPAKSARPRAKAPAKGKARALAKSKTKVRTPAKVKAKAKPASKAVAGRKGARR
jgi:hypothetical protein